MRGDDAAGLEVVRIVHERAPGVDAVAHEGEPSALIGLWDGAAEALVVDAVQGGRAGELHRLEILPGGPFPPTWLPSTAASTHSLDLALVIELARSLGRLPDRLMVIGICGEAFGTAAPLSGPARRGVDAAAELVLARIAGAGKYGSTTRG